MEMKEKAAACCLGVKVPLSRFLNEKRIERINAARYEGQEIAAALHLVQPGDRVLELGAGIGIVGAVIAKNAQPARVLSYEANPALVPVIRELHAMNGLADRCEVRNEILVSAPNRPSSMPFHVHNSYLGSSLGGDPGRAKAIVDVPTADFDAAASESDANVLVMDIEGGELEILKHAKLDRFRAAIIEFHPKAYGVEGMRRCKEILREAGFAPDREHSTRLVWAAVRPEGAAESVAP